jgi:Mn-containing catalase
MFDSGKELQFDAWVGRPDPRFTRLLLKRFGGRNDDLRATMKHLFQTFAARRSYSGPPLLRRQ